MKIISFGEYRDDLKYKVLEERQMRASAGIMFLLGIIAFINGFILQNYIVIPFISGFLVLNFMIGIFINPKFSPTLIISSILVRKQTPLLIGAVQKKFAWSLGLMLATVIFSLSLVLINDVSFFGPVCLLCIICLVLLYFESAFGICIGCKFYKLAIKMNIIRKPTENPNCMGDACDID